MIQLHLPPFFFGVRTPEKSGLSRADREFLLDAAARILAGSHVATTTAQQLTRRGMDATRLAQLITTSGASVGDFRVKLITADPETPDNFGVLVRLDQSPKQRV